MKKKILIPAVAIAAVAIGILFSKAYPKEAESMPYGMNELQYAEMIEAIEKINHGGDASDLDTIVEDYYLILKSLHKDGKPGTVILSEEDFACVIVDGQVYDLYMIELDDEDNTNRRMEIEVLLNDETPMALVQERLNAYIQENW